MWTRFETALIPTDAPEQQRRLMRVAFYAGAEELYNSVIYSLSSGSEAEESDLAYLSSLQAEIMDFAKELADRLELRRQLRSGPFAPLRRH